MDPDKLAERDRARRMRQLRNAKLQGLALIFCLVVGLVWALVHFFYTPQKQPPAKEPVISTGVLGVPGHDPDKPALLSPPKTAGEPPKTGQTQPPKVETSTPLSPAIAEAVGKAPKPSVPVANVLASIGVTDSEKSKRALPKVDEARRVLGLLSHTNYISGKLDFVIEKPGIELRMKQFYETSMLKEPEVGEQVADLEIQMAGERYLDVIYKNSSRPSGTMHVSFLRDERGVVRVDWESFVGFASMNMREFRDRKPEEPVTMRVFASVDDYYNYEFTDPKKYLSVRLRNADGSEAVNGFCELGGRVATAINARLATSNAADSSKTEGGAANKRSWAPIIVKVRFPSKAQSDHCVELMELMHGQWLAPSGIAE